MKYFLVVVAVLVGGCAVPDHLSDSLHARYSRYQSEVNSSNLQKVAREFFTEELLRKGDIRDSRESQQLLFKRYMSTQLNYFEKIDGDVGCLTVEGYDNGKMPLEFNLKYERSNGQWRIGKIGVVFLDDVSNFSKGAVCPED